MYCPRCEEVYIPKFRVQNIDGVFFGTSFPHHFLTHFRQAVILPPKIYHYEPKIYGFKVAGKRGSKYYDPPRTNIRYNYDTMTGMDREKLIDKIRKQQPNDAKYLHHYSKDEDDDYLESQTQKTIRQNYFVEKSRDPEQIIKEAVSQEKKKNEGTPGPEEESTHQSKKKNKKKNKNK